MGARSLGDDHLRSWRRRAGRRYGRGRRAVRRFRRGLRCLLVHSGVALELANFILELEKIDLRPHVPQQALSTSSWLAWAVAYVDEAGTGASEGLTIMPSVERITLPMVASLSFPGRAFTMPAGMRINAMMWRS
jgi:hypothetical protein